MLAPAREDNIRAVSDPLNIKHEFVNAEGIPTHVLSSPEALAKYLKNLNDANLIEKLSFYGREIRHISKISDLYNTTTQTFAK